VFAAIVSAVFVRSHVEQHGPPDGGPGDDGRGPDGSGNGPPDTVAQDVPAGTADASGDGHPAVPPAVESEVGHGS
jgi:hypothetical protein